MKISYKRHLCLAAAFFILFSAVRIFPNVSASAGTAISIIKAEGGFESAYVLWTGIADADGYSVYIKKADADYIKLDEELVRTYPDYFRADAVGLSAGEYTFKIVAEKGGNEIGETAAETEVFSVSNYTREGFAFSKNSPYGTSNGAYNGDGTIKPTADVIYLTNGNKDTVTINGDESKGVGLYNILAYREAKKVSTPLDIRVIGKVDEPDFVNIHTVRFINTSNVTLEGIGDDATIFGWIITLKRTSNFEIRNIGMMYGGEGTTGSAIVLDTDNKNVWVHNCDFFYGAPGKDADQIKGDGAIDLKSRSDYVTISYNHYWDLGKTCVSGGPWENSNMYTDEAKIFVTYHHNWFDHTDSRHPRCVVGSNHVYNNYYDGNAMYGIGAAMKTSVFSENNYYRNCPRPMIIASQGSDCYDSATDTYQDKGTLSGQMGGIIKSFGDVIVTPKRFYSYQDLSGTKDAAEFDAYIASSRDEVVPDSVKAKKGDEFGYGVYNNFDTNPDIMYEYKADTAEEAVVKVKKYAGRVNGGDFKWTFNNTVDDEDHSVNQALLTAIKSYESSLLAVAGGKVPVEPPYVAPTEAPTEDPNATPAPTMRPPGDIIRIPVGASSYAKDWFNGAPMSKGDVSLDGYVGCYIGSGNSYKTNKFSAGGAEMTRGYQTKQIDSRAFYCMPETECMVTVYFYTNGNNSLALYTTNLSAPAATFVPDAGGGDYAYTYHFTDVGSALYIAGPLGDINLAGISVTGAGGTPTEKPGAFDYEVVSAAYVGTGMEVDITCNNPGITGKLIAVKYNENNMISDIKVKDISISGKYVIEDFSAAKEDSAVLYIWNDMDSIQPMSRPYNVE